MKKIILFITFILASSSFVTAETLSLNTFYPAPFGVYNQVRLVPLTADPLCNANNNGLMWIFNANGQLRYCWGGVINAVRTTWIQDVATSALYPVDWANPNLKVGIGTITPGALLDINAGVYPLNAWSGGWQNNLRIRASHFPSLRFYSTNVGKTAMIGNNNDGGLWFSTNGPGDTWGDGTYDMVLSSLSNLGIGYSITPATLPATTLQFGSLGTLNQSPAIWTDRVGLGSNLYHDGTWKRVDNTKEGTNLGILNGGSGNVEVRLFKIEANGLNLRNFANFGTGSTQFLEGVVGIGTGVLPITAKLHVVGTGADVFLAKTFAGPSSMLYGEIGNLVITGGAIRADGFFYNSDITLKENIKPVSGLENILKLQGIQFNWKKSGAPDVGLSAQNVEETFPDLVSTDPTTHLKSVKYGNLVAPLIEAVKNQHQQIEGLKKELEDLKSQHDRIAISPRI